MMEFCTVRPENVSITPELGGWLVTMRPVIRELTNEEMEFLMSEGWLEADENGMMPEAAWECPDVVTVHLADYPGEQHYGRLVTAVVRSRYSADDVEALLNNYVSSKTTEHKKEWAELQAWRTHAKELAHEAIELVTVEE